MGFGVRGKPTLGYLATYRQRYSFNEQERWGGSKYLDIQPPIQSEAVRRLGAQHLHAVLHKVK